MRVRFSFYSPSFLRPVRHIGKILLMAMLASVALWGQIDRAVLEGTVTDPTGAAIAGASVKALAVNTGISEEKTTNSKGYYRFPGLAVGRYTVTVTSVGFKINTVEDVILQVGQTRTLDTQLEVGTINEQVEVKASSAPADRSSAEASTVITSQQIENLPNNGRDWASFTLLAPFAQDDGGGDQRTIRFAGRARDDNNFQIDGVDAGGIQEQAQKSQTRLQISQDAIEEYRVNSALYDAEYGTQAGGQVDVETKSGTNNFHGAVFGYLRNSVFDSRNFNDFDVNGNPAIPPFRYGQYGLDFGGPAVKDKLFFFINYEGLRQYGQTTTQVLVPNPVTQQATLATSPQMCSILQVYPWRASVGSIGSCKPRYVFPDGAFVDQTNNPSNPLPDSDLFTAPGPTTVHEDTWLVRMDYKINDKTTLYGSAHRDISLVSSFNISASSLPYDLIQTINHPAGYYIALQNTFTPRVLNEAKVFINRSPFLNPQVAPIPYSVQTNDWVTINNNQTDHEIGTTYGVVDNLTLVRGRNTFKTGMEIRRVRLNQGLTESNTLSFQDNSSTADTGFEKAQLYGISFTASWCCHKLRRTFYMPYFQDEWKVRSNLTLNLGIRWEYYGVAHEADNRTTVFDVTQFHGVCFGSGSTWRFSQPNPIPTPINTPACPQNPALYNADYRNFDPRVSFAWAPDRWHGKTVVRSGFGIYHGAAQNDDLNAGLESDRFTAFATFDPSGSGTPLLPGYQQAVPDLNPLEAQGLQTAEQPRALQRQGRRDLYVETWGLTIDNELPANFLLSLQYLGSHGVRLFSRGGVNFCSTKPAGTDANGNIICTRPLDQFYPGGDPYGSVDYKSDIGASTYHALMVGLERRFTNGLSFQSRYTWSHSINDGSVGGGESNGPENVNCLACDKGPSVYDIRHNFVADAVYELPFGSGKQFLNNNGTLSKVVGGWKFSSLGLWRTGHPLTVTLNIDPSQLPDGNDQTTQRPDLVPGQPILLPGGIRNHQIPVNLAAFAPPPLDPTGIIDPVTGTCVSTCGLVSRFGTSPNGVIRAPSAWQIDMALVKETKLTERVSTEFGVQVFNIFNHVQLGDPSTDNLTLNYTNVPDSNNNPTNQYILVPKGNFGLVNTTNNFNNNNDNAASPNTGTGLPRQIQFMLRVTF